MHFYNKSFLQIYFERRALVSVNSSEDGNTSIISFIWVRILSSLFLCFFEHFLLEQKLLSCMKEEIARETNSLAWSEKKYGQKEASKKPYSWPSMGFFLHCCAKILVCTRCVHQMHRLCSHACGSLMLITVLMESLF